eukprot:10793612-Lingulodinium_polyedra.AAC.1
MLARGVGPAVLVLDAGLPVDVLEPRVLQDHLCELALLHVLGAVAPAKGADGVPLGTDVLGRRPERVVAL